MSQHFAPPLFIHSSHSIAKKKRSSSLCLIALKGTLICAHTRMHAHTFFFFVLLCVNMLQDGGGRSLAECDSLLPGFAHMIFFLFLFFYFSLFFFSFFFPSSAQRASLYSGLVLIRGWVQTGC